MEQKTLQTLRLSNVGKAMPLIRAYQFLLVCVVKTILSTSIYMKKRTTPHGLVAGTTGSGKSEIIQSYILSLAVNFHPHDVVLSLD
ncbi:FtsK/SpoIIIE domain-containing protein [Streptococcus iniae]